MSETSGLDPEANFDQAMLYVATNAPLLAEAVLGERLSIDTICFFSQNPDHYQRLLEGVLGHGPVSRFTHGKTTYVDVGIDVADQQVKFLGVRQPDSTRPERGYGDYPVADLGQFLAKHKGKEGLYVMNSSLGQPMVELRHPDFDLRGYVIDAKDHEPEA